MKRLLTTLIGNTVFANVVLAALLVLGLLAVLNMKRTSMPELKLDSLLVSIPFPGADPEEVEEGVSRRVEAVVDGMEGVKQYSTTSVEGASSTVVEVADGYDIAEVKQRLRDGVDGISTFPAGVEKAVIRQLKNQEEVIDLALWGDLPERQLKEWAETVRAELQQLPELSLVHVMDTRQYEVKVEVAKERLLEYGLTLADVSRAIQQANINSSTGSIQSRDEEINLRTIGKKYTGQEFGRTVVKALPSGEVITLDRVATITDGFTDKPSYATFNGHPAVMVWVEKAEGEDALAISDAVRRYAAERERTLPEGVHLSPCFDDSEFIRGQISLLTRNGLAGLMLVLVVLWLFLNSRLSFWVAMGLPVSLSGALIVMWLSGATINQITLITFIVAIGIIVDDAIVVGEAIYHHRRRGEPPLQAAVEGVREVGLPVIAAVLTTMMAFLPLAFVGGIMGQMMRVMPLVVLSALAVSLIESLFLLPAHLNHLPELKDGAPAAPGWRGRLSTLRKAPARALERFAASVYFPAVRLAVAHRYVALCAAAAVVMLTAGLIGGNVVRVVFWPPTDGNHLRAFVEFPPGTPAEVTRDAIEHTRSAIERVAARTPTTSGKPLIRDVYTRVFPGAPHTGRVVVEMLQPSERGVHSQDLSAAWQQEVGPIQGAVAQTFFEDQINVGGPPIEIWLQGKEMEDLLEASAALQAKLRSYAGVYQVNHDFRPGKTELQVRLKPEAHTLGLTLEQVARHLRGGYYGEEAVRFQRGRDDVRVRVRFPENERQTLTELERSRILTPQGHAVPLLSVVDIQPGQGYASIRGTNGMRRIVVTAAVNANVASSQQVLNDLAANYLDALAAQHDHLLWSFRGAAQNNQQTMDGLKQGFAMALIGIFVIMATIFRSYAQPFVILLIVPFGMVGATLGHLVMGIPLTFLSLFGLVALTGVVVNDAIVMVECVNKLVADRVKFFEALCQAGVRRFRPVFLTTATTSIGLMPLVLEKDLQAQIVIPMAVAISFGVLFATLLTLLLLPCLLGVLNDLRRVAYRLRHGVWPAPEAVEPGTKRRAIRDAQDALLGQPAEAA